MNEQINISLTRLEDLEEVMIIYDKARSFMREHGNLKQWANGYPNKEIILEDIANQRSYVITKEEQIIGVFTFINGEDETYHYIEGKWLNDAPYGVIHRIASGQNEKGILHIALSYCFQFVNNIRIDTHKDNIVMQKALLKEGFIKCGVIYLKNGDPRLAYQKVI